MMLFGHNRFLAVARFVICCCWCFSLLVAEAQEDNITAPSEVSALNAIKESLVDPYKNLESWSKGGDPCASNWNGVLCYNTTLDDGYLHVTELQLLNMNLSGSLAPELGNLSYMKILDFMWNNISGSIPKEIGSISTLELLLLNGNHLTGSLPDELGNLRKLDRIQIDTNQISGPVPKSFANLTAVQHFHMNNNSISGQIPFELYRLPKLVHILLDNNNLTGYLPSELSQLPNLRILQLDNNNFTGTTIPESYSNMSALLKMSLRNCGLQGPIPDLSRIPRLGYLDLSSNQLNGSIPENKLSANITTIDLSNNRLTGTIPTNLSDLPLLQKLSVAKNLLNGAVPASIWQSRSSNYLHELVVELQNNSLSSISGSIDIPQNVTVWLKGNPLCSNATLSEFCGSESGEETTVNSTSLTGACNSQTCPSAYECFPALCPGLCFCAAPLHVQYRLKSPGLSNFTSYQTAFEEYLTSGLEIDLNQLNIELFVWEKGPRLRMYLEIFPQYDAANNNNSRLFNNSEVRRIRGMFTSWEIPDSSVFGPYELLAFPLVDPYGNGLSSSSSSGISKGALAGIIVGAIAGAVIVSAIISLFITRAYMKKRNAMSRRRLLSRISIKIDGVKDFMYREMALATNDFDSSAQVGQGGYGKVYRGILADGTAVAIKRAQEASLQGEKEFLTEIELLSRLHHRNLVSLLGYCDEEGEQMLVYQLMPNGTLRDHLSAKSKEPLSFSMRLSIALGSAKGILYLHTEADPPIFHRDIKASNILLDSKMRAKVADFGLSRLAPVPNLEGNTPAHVSTVVKGTPGYLDPEYFLTHKLTDKSDVYSLGVVFLELLSGMPPISHGKNIVREFNHVYQSGTIFSIIDKRMGSYPSECVEKFVKLAIQCCQEETDARPSMAEVVRALEHIADMVPDFDSKTITKEFSSDTSGYLPSSMMSPSSSSAKNPYSMSDVSGSALISGVVPTITPR